MNVLYTNFLNFYVSNGILFQFSTSGNNNMESTSLAQSAIVYIEKHNRLSFDEAVDILREPDTSKISLHAAISPQPGNIFLFNTEHKVRFCEDGLAWTHCGRKKIPKEKPVCHKTYYKHKSMDVLSSLRRVVYTEFATGNNFVLVHYLNDECNSKTACRN